MEVQHLKNHADTSWQSLQSNTGVLQNLLLIHFALTTCSPLPQMKKKWKEQGAKSSSFFTPTCSLASTGLYKQICREEEKGLA